MLYPEFVQPTYVPRKQRCDSCANFVVAKSNFVCFATKRFYKVRRSTWCVSKNVIHIAFCLNCLKQGVGSTVIWKSRLQNSKSHIKKKVRSCSIVNHFIDVFRDTDDPSRNIRFIIIDQLNKTNSLSPDEIEIIFKRVIAHLAMLLYDAVFIRLGATFWPPWESVCLFLL